MGTPATSSAKYPFSVQEALDFCRADESLLKEFETILLPVAFEMVECESGRLLVRREICEAFEECPEDGRFNLSYGPICQIHSIETSQGEEWTQEDLNQFEVSPQDYSPWVGFRCGTCLCQSGCCPTRYRIKYLAGPTNCEISARAKLLFLQFICEANAHRGVTSTQSLKETPLFKRVIRSLKRPIV